MRAVEVGRHGGPDVLELVERDDPVPGDGELLVEVAAAGVNYIDTYQRSGAYPTEPPFVLGIEGAGRVVSVGPGVADVRPGDRVATDQLAARTPAAVSSVSMNGTRTLGTRSPNTFQLFTTPTMSSEGITTRNCPPKPLPAHTSCPRRS